MTALQIAAQDAAKALADLKADVARERAAGRSLRSIASEVTGAGYRVTHTTVDEWTQTLGPIGPAVEVTVVRPAIGYRSVGSRAGKTLYRFTARRMDGELQMHAEVQVEHGTVGPKGDGRGTCWSDPLTRDQLRALAVAVLDGRDEATGVIRGAYTPGTRSHGEPLCWDCEAEVVVVAEADVEDGPLLELAECHGWEWR